MTHKNFYYFLLATVLFRALVSVFLPINGDEAYYVLWGKYPSWGYYDHPPLAGWVHSILYSAVGDRLWFYRMLAVSSTTLVALVIRLMLKERNAEQANFVAAIYLISPLNFLFLMSGPEIFVLLTLFGCVYFSYKALNEDQVLWSLCAGVCLALAALSKFITVLVVPGLVIWLFRSYPTKKVLVHLAVLALIAVVGVGLNLDSAAQSCWSTFRFNFGRLSNSQGFNARSLGLFGVTLLFLLWPLLWRIRSILGGFAGGSQTYATQPLTLGRSLGGISWVFVAAFLVFLYVSLKNTVGLHWFLGFYPCFFVLLWGLKPKALGRVFIGMAAQSLSLLVVVFVLAWHLDPWISQRIEFADLVIMREPKTLCNAFEDLAEGQDFIIGTQEYSHASILELSCHRKAAPMDRGPRYGRSFDHFVDYRQLQDKLVIYVTQFEPQHELMSRYLSEYRAETVNISGFPFNFVLGRFQYERFRELILSEVWQKYYQPPWALLDYEQCHMSSMYGFLRE